MRALIALFLLVTQSWAFTLKPGLYQYDMTLKKGDKPRTFLVQSPKKILAHHAYPLVVFFHSEHTDPKQMAKKLEPHVNLNRMIALYPKAKKKWWHTQFDPSDESEMKFIQSILKQLPKQIDQRKIFAVGFDRGGALVNQLIIDHHLFSRAALFNAPLTPQNLPTKKTRPISIFQFQGKKGETPPFHGDHDHLSFYKTAKIWAKHHQCHKHSVKRSKNGNTILRFSACQHRTRLFFMACKRCKESIPDDFSGDLYSFLLKKLGL